MNTLTNTRDGASEKGRMYARSAIVERPDISKEELAQQLVDICVYIHDQTLYEAFFRGAKEEWDRVEFEIKQRAEELRKRDEAKPYAEDVAVMVFRLKEVP